MNLEKIFESVLNESILQEIIIPNLTPFGNQEYYQIDLPSPSLLIITKKIKKDLERLGLKVGFHKSNEEFGGAAYRINSVDDTNKIDLGNGYRDPRKIGDLNDPNLKMTIEGSPDITGIEFEIFKASKYFKEEYGVPKKSKICVHIDEINVADELKGKKLGEKIFLAIWKNIPKYLNPCFMYNDESRGFWEKMQKKYNYIYIPSAL